MKSFYKLSLIVLVTFLVTGLNCNSPTQPTPPPPPAVKGHGSITISLSTTSCTEAWIQVKTDSVTLPVNLNLIKDNTVSQAFSLNISFTLKPGAMPLVLILQTFSLLNPNNINYTTFND